ncbi:hypothetical protein FRC17_004535 [Serendipita sp. 399]|nr:hypothetical protein FRC17_004535 [Serendipita sp. 399]
MAKVDILVLGATGYTGQLVTEYLEKHPSRDTFTLGIGGRSFSKLQQLSKDLSLSTNVGIYPFDISDFGSVSEVVQKARVIINCIGPFMKWSTPVVRACASQNVHYVDITGEAWWIKDLIRNYDYQAMKTKTIIIPASGFDSVPSDLAAYLSARALAKRRDIELSLGRSVTGLKFSIGFSGGTLATTLSLSEIAPSQLEGIRDPYWLTSVKGRRRPTRLIYSLPYSQIYGGISPMGAVNEKIVNRTWGLFESRAQAVSRRGPDTESSFRYGPNFCYEEFTMFSNRIFGFFFSVGILVGMAAISLLSPVRWFLKTFGVKPGSGPKQAFSDKSKTIKLINVTSTDGPNPDHVKTNVTFHGDPYVVTAVTVGESALAILFNHDDLPKIGQAGGILTPMSALGDTLVKRLLNSSYLTYETHTLHPNDSRKTR